MEGSQHFDHDPDAVRQPGEAPEEQRLQAAETAGAAAASGAAELRTYDYFQRAYEDMDWTPEL